MTTKQCPIIAITNHKGGVGKTTTTVNLAAEFGKLGKNVLVVDIDPQSNASLHIGTVHPSMVNLHVGHLLESDDPNVLINVVRNETKFEGVSLIYSSLQLDRLESRLPDMSPRPNEELKAKLANYRELFDVILIDCPPSLRPLTNNALAAATHLIIPIESGSQYGMYGATDLMERINQMTKINPGLKNLGGLLIRHDRRQMVCTHVEKEALKLLGSLLPVTISTSTKVKQAEIGEMSISELDRTSKPAREYRLLAAKLAVMLGIGEAAAADAAAAEMEEA